ncbi:S8 family peptidase [Streptomyces sp. BI20]|uniref:S8 family peptidase n=1 Tax=Streptomyces sp. BI20 TaxID=3403460 RepID=UPI003C714BC1
MRPKQPSRHHPSPWPAVTALVAALTLTAALPAGAAPAPPGAPPAATSAPKPVLAAGTGPAAGPVTVTLVTGDRILVTTDAAGRAAATALPRPDGTRPLIQTRTEGPDLHVYPEGAVDALAAGRVDPELFNVTGLIRQGQDDAHSTTLPLIAVHDRAVDLTRAAPPLPRGVTGTARTLASLGARAFRVEKTKAAEVWADTVATPVPAAARGNSPARGLRTLWLDGRVTATLDRSTRQIGAPTAWAAGYDGKGVTVAVLDTGTDLDHPDLTGRVADSRNFTDSDDDRDHQGHGTHTISTVGGTGAASAGAKKGVAPGARLLSGKVLGDQGYGQDSWIIAGMEWAVAQGADVVSMSLGDSSQRSCDDPMSQAMTRLAADKRTLFVVAAGNDGPGNDTVSAPGCVPAALTVGAVDRDERTAVFSSRGPAGPEHILKPEIAAPGVGISAAAAGGRGVYAYREMSGTSMATPHVAGAAALLKQRRPDWDADRIKAALVGSARDKVPGDVREVGAGRVEVPAALAARVLSAPAVQGGTYAWPQKPADRTRVQVPYTNTGTTPITLTLGLDRITGNDGSAVRSPIARLGARTLTVPAGRTVTVPLELDPTARLERAQYGDVTGRITATGPGGTRVTTPFALYVEPTTVTLTVKLLDRAGKPADGASSLDVIGTDDASGERRWNEGAAEQTYRVRPGAYFLSAFVATPDAGPDPELVDSLTYLGRPQVEIRRDTTVTLDARRAGRLTLNTERPSETRTATLAFARSWDEVWLHAATASGGHTLRGYYASVEGRARDGAFEFGSYWRAAAPLLTEFGVVGGPALHPLPASTGSDNLDGAGAARLVDAGTGTPEELAAAGARDALVLVRAPEGENTLVDQARAAREAGAKGILAHRDAPGRWAAFTGYAGGALPTLTLEASEAKALFKRLATGPVTLRWKGTATSPHLYTVDRIETGELRGDRAYRVRDRDLGRVDASYETQGVAAPYVDLVTARRPGGAAVSFGGLNTVPAPGRRTEFLGTGATTWEHLLSSSFPWGEFMTDRQRAYRPGSVRSEKWYDGVLAPVAALDANGAPTLAAERQGNLIGFASALWGDGTHHAQQGAFGEAGNLTLSRDGEQIGESGYPFGAFEVPADAADYELTQNIEKFGAPAAVWQRSQAIRTTWAFRSAEDPRTVSTPLPVIFPRVGLPKGADALKTVPAADRQTLTLTATGHAGHTPGDLRTAALSWSYDGENWTAAKVEKRAGTWTAQVDHAGAAGKPVWLRIELTDTKGAKVTQTIVRAYDVRS